MPLAVAYFAVVHLAVAHSASGWSTVVVEEQMAGQRAAARSQIALYLEQMAEQKQMERQMQKVAPWRQRLKVKMKLKLTQ